MRTRLFRTHHTYSHTVALWFFIFPVCYLMFHSCCSSSTLHCLHFIISHCHTHNHTATFNTRRAPTVAHITKYLMKVSEQLTVFRRDAVRVLLLMGYLCLSGEPAAGLWSRLLRKTQRDTRGGGDSGERWNSARERKERCISSHRLLAVNWLLSAEAPDVPLLQWDFSLFPRGDLGMPTLLNQCFGLLWAGRCSCRWWRAAPVCSSGIRCWIIQSALQNCGCSESDKSTNWQQMSY